MSGLNKPFLKWWVQFVCTVFAVILSWELGWLHALYNADITKISILILALFAMTTGLTGYMSKNVLLNTSETQKLVSVSICFITPDNICLMTIYTKNPLASALAIGKPTSEISENISFI